MKLSRIWPANLAKAAELVAASYVLVNVWYIYDPFDEPPIA